MAIIQKIKINVLRVGFEPTPLDQNLNLAP
jgi:hypothetical protein